MPGEETSFRVKVVEQFKDQPGGDIEGVREPVDREVETLADARAILKDEIPVSLDSGDPMHYDAGDHDVYDIGRVYHYWRTLVGSDKSAWVDAWVSVTRIHREPVKYNELVPGTGEDNPTEPDGEHAEP